MDRPSTWSWVSMLKRKWIWAVAKENTQRTYSFKCTNLVVTLPWLGKNCDHLSSWHNESAGLHVATPPSQVYINIKNIRTQQGSTGTCFNVVKCYLLISFSSLKSNKYKGMTLHLCKALIGKNYNILYQATLARSNSISQNNQRNNYHRPTLPSDWSVFGLAVDFWTDTIALFIFVCKSLSSWICNSRRILAASLMAESKKPEAWLNTAQRLWLNLRPCFKPSCITSDWIWSNSMLLRLHLSSCKARHFQKEYYS